MISKLPVYGVVDGAFFSSGSRSDCGSHPASLSHLQVGDQTIDFFVLFSDVVVRY